MSEIFDFYSEIYSFSSTLISFLLGLISTMSFNWNSKMKIGPQFVIFSVSLLGPGRNFVFIISIVEGSSRDKKSTRSI